MSSLTSGCTNNELFQRVFTSIFTVAARRTSESFAAIALSSIKDSLKLTYSFDFLNYVAISKQGIRVNKEVLEDVDSDVLINVFDSVTRVIYTDLDEKAGLFFIKELKEEIGHSIVSTLSDHGLNFDLMALEQRHLQRRRSEKSKHKEQEIILDLNSKEENKQVFSSDLFQKDIHSCHIHVDDLTCTFFDDSKKEIAKISLKTVFHSFVDFLKNCKDKNEEVKFSEETIQIFLQLIQSGKQVSIDYVKQKFDFSISQMDQLIRHLLKKKFVRYETINQIVITDKGRDFVNSL
jgi:predicted transcriptional regulator